MYNGDMSTYYAEKFYTMGKRIEARLVALDMNQTDLHDDALIGAIKSVGAQREIDKLKRRERMQQVSAIGLAMLDEPPHVANAWLRRNVRLWCKDGRIVVVDWF